MFIGKFIGLNVNCLVIYSMDHGVFSRGVL